MNPEIAARCWAHGRRGHTEWHFFTAEQAARLLELMSFEDWEDGPRCLLEVLAEDDGETP